jgi:hypothetical protein
VGRKAGAADREMKRFGSCHGAIIKLYHRID